MTRIMKNDTDIPPIGVSYGARLVEEILGPA